GVAKTPAWAEAITGVPASTIASLAREYATTKPAALIGGIAPGRSAYGEQYHRAAITLAAMTGNIGIHGGDSAARSWGGEYWGGEAPFVSRSAAVMRSGGNPVGKDAPTRPNILPARGNKANSSACLRVMDVPDAILRGRAGGYPADIKGVYLVNTNFLNQFVNTNKCVEAFKKLDLMVVHEQFMTPTAKFADIILPVTTFLERNDITSGGATPFYGAVNKVIDNVGEAKSHLEIGTALAEKLGLKGYNEKSEQEWLKGIWESYGFPIDYETFKKKGIYKIKLSEPYVAFKKEIEDPEHHPFPTPSGKIEIYSKQLADMHHPQLPPVPKYVEPWEGPNDPLRKKYPLQLVTTHIKRRAHTQFETMPWLRELQVQAASLSSADAKARGIKDGDMVRIFNGRGQMILPVRVTERLMPGVVDIPQGAWYNPDEKGVDRGGCVIVLCSERTSP
ncbi:MAG: molybdopterin-dependent oxidoreductase, partial [Chloroflexota bacterium]|nr:molybdopterin-dependent oxidoreductase [Chloroflexota bacterium]